MDWERSTPVRLGGRLLVRLSGRSGSFRAALSDICIWLLSNTLERMQLAMCVIVG